MMIKKSYLKIRVMFCTNKNYDATMCCTPFPRVNIIHYSFQSTSCEKLPFGYSRGNENSNDNFSTSQATNCPMVILGILHTMNYRYSKKHSRDCRLPPCLIWERWKLLTKRASVYPKCIRISIVLCQTSPEDVMKIRSCVYPYHC